MSGLLTFQFYEKNAKSGNSIIDKMKRLSINYHTCTLDLIFILHNVKSPNC